MKVLFMDDDPTRVSIARNRYRNHELHVAFTVEEAIQEINKHSPFDLVCLDHDMQGKPYSPSDENSGFWVAKLIAEDLAPARLPKQVIIHTWYKHGANRMVAILRHKIPTTWETFKMKDLETRP